MDANLKAKWVDALRSGEYKQGIGYLNNEGGFCCLGVLCDISGVGQWISDPSIESCKRYVTDGAWDRATLPLAVEDKFNVPSATPLVTMNDSGRTFSEIADWIEANIPADQPEALGEE